MSWKVTVRHGSKVTRGRFDDLDAALDDARRRLGEIRQEGGLKGISALREFSPAQRVQARIEISGPGLIRAPEAGIDLMGDGELVAYRGTIRKSPLPAETLEQALFSIRQALGGQPAGQG